MTAIVLQARIDSTRLPGKALLNIEGKPILFHVMEALNHVKADERILACSEDSLSAFEPIAAECGFKIFAGPKEDVLERYCQVIRKYSIDRVIRATGDNPFVFADAAEAINSEAAFLNADYAGYLNLPYGAGVESVAASALLLAAKDANAFEREHVCPYLYDNPDKFKVHRSEAPAQWRFPDIRLTIDTQEDFERAKDLYKVLKDTPQKYNGVKIINAYKEFYLGKKS